MRIAISGAQSVGKSTLIESLKKDLFFEKFIFKGDVARTLKAEGIPINEQGNDITQIMVTARFLEIFAYDNCICDRSILDCMTYTHYHYTRNEVSKKTLELVYHVFKYLIYKYDILYYIPPQFDIVHDGIRSDSKPFQSTTDQIMQQYLKDFKVPYIELTGTVEERVKIVKDSINAFKEYNNDSKKLNSIVNNSLEQLLNTHEPEQNTTY